MQFNQNINKAIKVLDSFSEELPPHIAVEDLFFSFSEKHIPKLQAVIQLLQAEHQEILSNLKNIRSLASELLNERKDIKKQQITEQLKEKGTYLIYLIGHHIQIEEETIFGLINKELHAEEKKDLTRRLNQTSAWRRLSRRKIL